MKKWSFPPELSWRLKVQPPAGQHKRWRVMKVFKEKGKQRYEQVLIPDLSLAVEPRKECDLIVQQLYRDAGAKLFIEVSNSDNRTVLKRFWDDVYKNKELRDRASALAKYERAVDAIGNVSLIGGTHSELQDSLNKKRSGNRQRESAVRINAILHWLKRGFKMKMKKEEHAIVRYLTWSELEKVLANIQDEDFKLFCKIAWGTGGRTGELLALTAKSFSQNKQTVTIRSQILRDGTQAGLKGKDENSLRVAFVHSNVRPLIDQFLESKPRLNKLDRLSFANWLKAAARKAFKDEDKHVKFHDLRHSYAVELAGRGVTLLQISQFLGNSQRVAEKHYVGFVATDSAIDHVEKLMKSS